MAGAASPLPEGITSLLDTDLYKLTMQCCVLKFFPDVQVTYSFTNRTPDKKLNRAAFRWLQAQVDKLESLRVTDDELKFLKTKCPYLTPEYLQFLSSFHLQPSKQLRLVFEPTNDTGSDKDGGNFYIETAGLWLDTILYEIPLLALISEAYFKFVETDWTHDGQVEKAYHKGQRLLQGGCIFSEFGSRRRRDYHTHDLVLTGLQQAADEGAQAGWAGKLSGTSNVHFAMKHNLAPIGTVAHEWFMGVAAITDDYENANELGLQYWTATFGEGVLAIALTDTFGTPAFLKAFKKPVRPISPPSSSTNLDADPSQVSKESSGPKKTYADIFTGTRQDSGSPLTYVSLLKSFYVSEGIMDEQGSFKGKEKKAIVFSDALTMDTCFEYKRAAEAAGFSAVFGIGTWLTNDYVETRTGAKSTPLNIVIKIASAAGRPAVKISDVISKNTGDKATVEEVKRRLGYTEKTWENSDEATRWGKEGQPVPK